MKKIFKCLIASLIAIPVCICGVGCNKVGGLEEDYEDNGEPYELVYYMVYNDSNTPQDIITMQNKLSTVLKKKINSTIKIIPYTMAEYTSKLSGAISASVKFDVCFTSPDLNPYITNVQREAFIPLNKLLPKYAPETWKQIPEQIWEQTKVDGKIYGSVNEQIFPRTYGYQAKSIRNIQDFLNERYEGISPEEVYSITTLTSGEEYDAFKFLDEYLTWLKENNRGQGGKIYSVDTASALLAYYGYDDLGTGMSTPGCVQVNDGTYTVVNQYETDAYKNILDTVYDWKAKNYIDDSASTFDLQAESTWKPGYLTGSLLRLGESHYFTSYVIGTMNAISSTSKNPARAMKFIELLRTDEEVHNILQFGVEDVNYIKDPDNPNRIAEFISGSGYNNQNFGWGLGCEFKSYLIPGQDDDQWQKVSEINKNTEITEIIGFNFDATYVKQKIADCKAIVNEYLTAFELGQYKASQKDAKYNEFINKLKAAGSQDIIKEKQKQLNAWLENKNK